jgi:hypothetical protein
MKIKTITCHEVYNHGASLQEYALLAYLQEQGHEAETIHYKPHYLSNHFKFWSVSNPKFDSNLILRLIYNGLKLPKRLLILPRKKAFDKFSAKYIKATAKLYKTNEELKADLPEADAYICGSDQIWNSFFQNGKDPAFYLDFVPDNKLKISYAASFAIDALEESIKPFVKEKVSRLNAISVREPSGKKILENLGITDVTHVSDPVFLVDIAQWEQITAPRALQEDYVYVYDCDSDPLIALFVEKLKTKHQLKIVTTNDNIKYADKNFSLDGPDVFLSLIRNASFVVSNSFHAVAFSIIFKKQFTVFNRSEKINTRMRDFVQILYIEEVLLKNKQEVINFDYVINYEQVAPKLNELIERSKAFLAKALV